MSTDAVADLAATLRAEATDTDERRLLVLAGDPERTRAAAAAALDAAGVPHDETTVLGPTAPVACERYDQKRAEELLGRTRTAVVVDAHGTLRPNALGRAVGAVDGGGLVVLLVPPLADWPDRRGDFDASLAVPPFGTDDVTGRFRRRLVALLRTHRGIAIVDCDDGRIERDGLTEPAPRRPRSGPSPPESHAFPTAAYAACRTDDQVDALVALERVGEPGRAVVLTADRGRGKSSAAGLAAAGLALEGRDVLVTAPQYRNAREVFARASELLASLDARRGRDREDDPRRLETETGRVRFERPTAAADLPGDPDVVVVDEAAALPVRMLERVLDAPAVVYATTVHGYEGAGRGFSVRFRERLADSDHEVTEASLSTPIRYAPGDPVEVWCFRALLLNARPAVDPLVSGARPEATTYRRLDGEDLLADEGVLGEVFGLLVVAHYRTEPDDLARLLDAPNVTVRALLADGHVVSVALLAREGGLDADRRAAMYAGGRVAGNMIPDVCTTQLRDERAGRPVGWRIMRIATHAAVRSRGLGSRLLDEIRAEAREGGLDWLGVGYGATPELVDFWAANGFRTVHLSTSRNERSGEHSAVMLAGLTDAGRSFAGRHANWFCDRIGSTLSDPLDSLDADVVRAVLAATDADPAPTLTDWEWRLVVGASVGAGLFDTAPRPFRRLALAHLCGRATRAELSSREERLLVLKALQARPWPAVADALDYESPRECMRAFGDVSERLVETYGTDAARAERGRLR